MHRCNCSAIMFKYFIIFKVCSTTIMGPRDAKENASQSIILPLTLYDLLYIERATVRLEGSISWHSHWRNECQTRIHLNRQLSSTDLWSTQDVPMPSVEVVGIITWSTEANEWVVCYIASYQQCLLNNELWCISTWPCIVLSCQLSHCLAPVLLHQKGQSPTTFFFDNVWMSNTMSSTTSFIIIHPLCISTNNCRLQTTHKSSSFRNTCSEPLSHYNLVSIKVA